GQRTIISRISLGAGDRFQYRAHVLGLDKPGESRPLSFSPLDADIEAMDEETGVIVAW
ncbi:hypothetical protein FRC17_005379, partial [Serendipita sp. 399]